MRGTKVRGRRVRKGGAGIEKGARSDVGRGRDGEERREGGGRWEGKRHGGKWRVGRKGGATDIGEREGSR